MFSYRLLLATAMLLAITAGVIVAGPLVAAQQYLSQGLHRIAMETIVEALLNASGIVLSGTFAALVVNAAARTSSRRGVAGLARALEVLAWLSLTVPVLAWVMWKRGVVTAASSTSESIVVAAMIAALIALYLAAQRLSGARSAELAARCSLPFAGLVFLTGIAGVGYAKLWLDPSGHPSGAPNILVIVLDTVRADRLSSYGYERPTTPEIDAFARKSIRFRNFFSTSSWTVPSHASLFTGLYPIDHGATQERVKLAPRFATLAEILKNAGFQTWGASGNPWMSPSVNLAQGFDAFVRTWIGDRLPRPMDVRHPANVAFEEFLTGADRKRPYFAFINYMDAHTPYAPPEPFLRRFGAPGADPSWYRELGKSKWSDHYRKRRFSEEELAGLSDLYDANLSSLSREVGKLLRMVERRGGFEDTLIVLTSDHGEHFGENGVVGHMFGLYNTTVRVPLMIRLPGGARAGETVSRKGQLVDLFVTLLDAAGVEFTGHRVSGFDLLDERESPRRSIFSEYYYPSQVLWQFSEREREEQADVLRPFLRRLRAVERYGYRFIWSSDGRHELYNVAADPDETHDLYPKERRSVASEELLRLLENEMLAYVGDLGASGELGTVRREEATARDDIDGETMDALRTLGYVR